MLNKNEKEIMKNWQGNLSKPIVSVCTITYNHEKYIAEAMDSFLMQETDFPFEIVIGEDCSMDGTREVIEKYIEQYPSIIKLIVSEKNLGMQENGKRTMKACTGKYIALCEGDDYWTDVRKLQIQKDFLEENKAYVICYTGVEAFDENGVIKNYIGGATKDLSKEELQQATPINTLTAMFKNLIGDFPPEFSISRYGDLFIWSILGNIGKGKYLCKIKPSRYRVHSGGVHSGISNIDKYDNGIVTYALLMNYNKRIGNLEISNYFKKNMLYGLIESNGSCFMIISLIKKNISRVFFKFKSIMKAIL